MRPATNAVALQGGAGGVGKACGGQAGWEEPAVGAGMMADASVVLIRVANARCIA